MSTILRPVGSQPPQVYWTRRLIVFGVAVLAVLIIWAIAARGGGGDADAAGTSDDVEDVDPDTVPTDPPATGTRTCTAEDLRLEIASDTRSYPAGAQPTFTVTITNTGSTSCAIDAGEAEREILITSGSDRIWSSHDCLEADAPERLLLLAAGNSDESTVGWQRIRSNEQCGSDLPAPRPGTYRAVAALAGAESEPAVFDLGD